MRISPPPPDGVPPGPSSKQPVPPITIAVMGATGSGKTSFINMASDSSLRIGRRLKSCTDEVQLGDEFTIDGRQVVLIDTPGFDDTTKSDTDVLTSIATFLATTYGHGSKLSGVIYIHRISDKRFTGIAGRNFKLFRELCGDSTLKNVALVTNMWGEVSQEDGEEREEELVTDFFKPALDKGAHITRHYNTAQSAHDIIRRIIKNQPVPLQIQREIVDEGKGILNTAAGEAVNSELNAQILRRQAELEAVKRELEKALREKDEETRQELENETRKLQERIERTRVDLETMTSRYDEEKRRMEDEIRRMREDARQEVDQTHAEHRRQVEQLGRLLEAHADASAAERQDLQHQVGQLQQRLDGRDQDWGWKEVASAAASVAMLALAARNGFAGRPPPPPPPSLIQRLLGLFSR